MTDFPYALAICLGFPLALVTTVVLLRMRAHDRKAEQKLNDHCPASQGQSPQPVPETERRHP